MDTDATGMGDASRRAAAKPSRGGLANAVFLAGSLDELGARPELEARFDEIRVTLPWGSLLRASVLPESSFADQARALLVCGGRLRLLVSVAERDASAGLEPTTKASMDRLARSYAARGFTTCAVRRATAQDIATIGSSWARRLGIPARREAWLLEIEREGTGTATS